MELEDRPLVERAKTDPEAFGELYDRHARTVYRLALSMLHNTAQAEDVTADVFLKALRGIGRYRCQGKPFSSWLYQVTRNTIANEYRRKRAEPLRADVCDRCHAIEDTVLLGEEVRQVWKLVDQLPRAQRTAMVLRFQEDLSSNTVAALMGRSEPAVKQLIFRAVQRLRSELASPDGAIGEPAHAMS